MNHIYFLSLLLIVLINDCFGAQSPTANPATTSAAAPQPNSSPVSTVSAPNPLGPTVVSAQPTSNVIVPPSYGPPPAATPTSQAGTTISGVKPVTPAAPAALVQQVQSSSIGIPAPAQGTSVTIAQPTTPSINTPTIPPIEASVSSAQGIPVTPSPPLQPITTAVPAPATSTPTAPSSGSKVPETYTPFAPTQIAPGQPVAQPQPPVQSAPTVAPVSQPSSAQPQRAQKPKEKKAGAPQQGLVIGQPPAIPVSPVQAPQTAMPKSKEQEAKEVPFEEGVDTLDVESGGNWLKKRVIWEDAQTLYEKIKNTLSAIFESRMEFFAKRADIDKELNYFFIDIGFAQGELEDTVQALLDLIEADRTQQGSLSSQERDIRDQLMNKKNEIEQLRADAKSIADLDTALDEALTQLLKQINLAATYEKQGWMKFKAIGQELDDKKARDDYAYIETAYKNIQAIQGYISSQLSDYSNSLLSKIHEYMNSIKSQLDDIKTSGIGLKQKLAELEDAKKKKEEESQRTTEQEQPAKKKSTSWYNSVLNVVSYPFMQLKKFFVWIFSKILGR